MTVFGRGASAVFRDRELNVVGLKRKGVGDEGALSISDDSKASGRRFAEFLRECGTDLRALFLEVLEKVFVRSDRLSGALDVARTRGKEASPVRRSSGKPVLSRTIGMSASITRAFDEEKATPRASTISFSSGGG